nr:hypothetical protein GCM10020093_116920 [Planobispora longispora]
MEVAEGRRGPEIGGPLVGDAVPVGEGLARPGVGEDEPGEVGEAGRGCLQQAERAREPAVPRREGEQLAQLVHHQRRSRFEPVQQRPNRGPHRAGRRRDVLAGAARRRLDEAVEVDPLVGGEAQRVGERGEDLAGGTAVAPLLQPREVLNADPGERGQLGPAQSGVRRREPPGSPTAAGTTASRRERRNAPSSLPPVAADPLPPMAGSLFGARRPEAIVAPPGPVSPRPPCPETGPAGSFP